MVNIRKLSIFYLALSLLVGGKSLTCMASVSDTPQSETLKKIEGNYLPYESFKHAEMLRWMTFYSLMELIKSNNISTIYRAGLSPGIQASLVKLHTAFHDPSTRHQINLASLKELGHAYAYIDQYSFLGSFFAVPRYVHNYFSKNDRYRDGSHSAVWQGAATGGAMLGGAALAASPALSYLGREAYTTAREDSYNFQTDVLKTTVDEQTTSIEAMNEGEDKNIAETALEQATEANTAFITAGATAIKLGPIGLFKASLSAIYIGVGYTVGKISGGVVSVINPASVCVLAGGCILTGAAGAINEALEPELALKFYTDVALGEDGSMASQAYTASFSTFSAEPNAGNHFDWFIHESLFLKILSAGLKEVPQVSFGPTSKQMAQALERTINAGSDKMKDKKKLIYNLLPSGLACDFEGDESAATARSQLDEEIDSLATKITSSNDRAVGCNKIMLFQKSLFKLFKEPLLIVSRCYKGNFSYFHIPGFTTTLRVPNKNINSVFQKLIYSTGSDFLVIETIKKPF